MYNGLGVKGRLKKKDRSEGRVRWESFYRGKKQISNTGMRAARRETDETLWLGLRKRSHFKQRKKYRSVLINLIQEERKKIVVKNTEERK